MGPGLGRALVRKFAHNGYNVAFVGRSVDAIRQHERELRAEGLEVTGFPGDAGEPEIMDEIHARIR